MQNGDSNSIKHQKEILSAYAENHNFGNLQYYVDEGVSGTVFNRPGLDAMLTDIKIGKISTVLIKDQSRIGRDVLEVGLLKKMFDEHNVRLIAANDNLDTANGFDIISVFRDVFNEWFVADTSMKIRAVAKAKALKGKHHTTQTPYGYMPSPEDKLSWVIDEPAANVVREIFKMFISGMGSHKIAIALREKNIKTPNFHKAQRDNKPARMQSQYPDNYWRSGVVASILDNLEYTGTAVMQKTTTKSYKDKKIIKRPEHEWIIQENAHDAIIDKETFETVKRLRKRRHRPTKSGDLGILNRLLFCEDCGGKLHVKRQTKKGKDGVRLEYVYYDCQDSSAFKKHSNCGCHAIKRESLEQLVFEELKQFLEFAKPYAQDKPYS